MSDTNQDDVGTGSEEELELEAEETKADPHCGFCGLELSEEEFPDVCPRCASPVAEADAEDEDEDDDEDDDDSKKDDDGEEDDDKKKVLLDKKKAKAESWNPTPLLSPIEEAQLYVALATQLDESKIKDLAAHIVWGTDEYNTSAPRWLPESYTEEWETAKATGRPRTFLAALTNFRGVFGSRTQEL